VLYPACIEAAVRELERRGCAAAAVNGHLIDGQGRIIRRLYRWNKPDLTLGKLAKGNRLFTTSQVLIRRAALLAIGGFNESAGSAVDWDLWIRLLQAGEKIAFVDRYLMGYRLHASNDSKNAAKMLRGEMHIVERTLEKVGNPKANRSYTYLRYSSRAGDWSMLAEAVRLNAALLLNPRFYMAVLQTVATRLERNKTKGMV